MPNPRTDAIIVDGLVLRPVGALCRMFGMRPTGVAKMLRALKVPIGYFGKKGYVAVPVLAEALLSCLDLGKGGFMAPGSSAKSRSAERDRPTLGDTELPQAMLHPRHRKVMQNRLNKLRTESRGKDRDFLRAAVAAVPPPVPRPQVQVAP